MITGPRTPSNSSSEEKRWVMSSRNCGTSTGAIACREVALDNGFVRLESDRRQLTSSPGPIARLGFVTCGYQTKNW